MSIHPNPSFPLLASDQADVIRIFLELMQERTSTARGPEVQTVIRVPRNNSHDSGPPSELFDQE